MCVCVVCVCAQLCLTFETPRNAAFQAPLSMQISRQEYWSGLPFPTPKEFKPIKWQRLNVCLSLHSSFVAMTGKKKRWLSDFWYALRRSLGIGFQVLSAQISLCWFMRANCVQHFPTLHLVTLYW